MKKILVLFLFSVGCSLYAQQFSADMKKTDIMKVCDAVAKWQIIPWIGQTVHYTGG